MAWHLNFRNYRYMTIHCVLHYFFYFVLCIKSAIFYVVISFARVAANDSAIAATAYLGKLWIFFYFNAPSLVISKMPVEIIHFMQSDVINIFFYKRNRKEMPANIKMHAAIGKAGSVLYGYIRKVKFVVCSLWFVVGGNRE